MIPILLLGKSDAQLTAGTSGSNVGYGDGTAYSFMPGASFGHLSHTLQEIELEGGTVAYIYTNASNDLTLGVKEDGSYTFDDGNSLKVGANSYAFSAATEAAITGGGGSWKRWVWTGATALVDGTTYSVGIV